jgi:hypothetical protein
MPCGELRPYAIEKADPLRVPVAAVSESSPLAFVIFVAMLAALAAQAIRANICGADHSWPRATPGDGDAERTNERELK